MTERVFKYSKKISEAVRDNSPLTTTYEAIEGVQYASEKLSWAYQRTPEALIVDTGIDPRISETRRVKVSVEIFAHGQLEVWVQVVDIEEIRGEGKKTKPLYRTIIRGADLTVSEIKGDLEVASGFVKNYVEQEKTKLE